MSLDFSKIKQSPLSNLNLSGGSIQVVLDELLYSALTPIVLNSNVFDAQINYILSRSGYNNKRKHSALPREEFIEILVKYCISDDRATKLECLINAKIERMFLFAFLELWLKRVKGYEALYGQWLVAKGRSKETLNCGLDFIETLVGMSRDHLFTTCTVVRQLKTQAEDFRNIIAHKYLKYAWKEATNFVEMHKTHDYNFQDVFQNFMGAVSHAIDRYDSSKGALTSYIGFWMLREKTSDTFGFENGVAYSVPQGVRANMARGTYTDQNFALSLSAPTEEGSTLSDIIPDDKLNQEQAMERTQNLNQIKKLAKLADPKGLARLYLDVDEYFSPKEIKRAKLNMIKQGIDPVGQLTPYAI
jgi:hypothetical protein